MQNFKSWLAQPFRTDMSALDWFYFFGLLIVISVVWGIILRHMRSLAASA